MLEITPEIRRDLKILTVFVRTYCKHQHKDACKHLLQLPPDYPQPPAHKPLMLCDDCDRLLTYALNRRVRCPMDPKPACKHCPKHCYAPKYRKEMQEVMKFSGRHLVMTGRLHYLWHLFF